MSFLLPGKANVIIDGQWGSTGKGKIAGYLAMREEITAVSCDYMTNAGHTFVDDSGKKTVFQQLPVASVNKDCLLMIGPTAAITLDVLMAEIARDSTVAKRLLIHPNAAIIDESCRVQEAETLNRISSTCKGCGAAVAKKVMRDPALKLARDVPALRQWVKDTVLTSNETIRHGGVLLIETAQGFSLSPSFGQYPYCTSRDISTSAALNGAGVAPVHVGCVIGCLRTYPIRVGNVYDNAGKEVGWSGPVYDGQAELTWADITRMSGSPEPIVETTTVTGKVRRVFEMHFKQLWDFLVVCEPTHLVLNFVNY